MVCSHREMSHDPGPGNPLPRSDRETVFNARRYSRRVPVCPVPRVPPFGGQAPCRGALGLRAVRDARGVLMIRTQIWNNGGGTQSAAIAALIVIGRLPKPDLAVIADTGRERSSTWDYLNAYIAPALASVGVTIHRVSKERYASNDLFGGKDSKTPLIPAFTTAAGDVGKLKGYCSGEWKRDVICRWATAEHGVKATTNWIGYSVDEIGRAVKAKTARKSQGKWQTRFPLIELGMNRGDCVALVQRMGWPFPPRSSC